MDYIKFFLQKMKLLKNHYKATCLVIFIFLTLSLGLKFYSPLNLFLGNIFFGRVHELYNVNLANFFFKQASYPPIGTPVQWSHYQLGRTNFIRGNLDLALTELFKEIKFFPENKRTYYMIGLSYGYVKQEKLAIEAFDQFISWKPESWAARNDKAWLEFRIGKIDDALKTIEPVAQLIDNAWVQNTYGVLLMNKKKYEEAKIAFEYAKVAADRMTEKEWGNTYPGNDPRVYATGLKGMRLSIDSNLKLLETKK